MPNISPKRSVDRVRSAVAVFAMWRGELAEEATLAHPQAPPGNLAQRGEARNRCTAEGLHPVPDPHVQALLNASREHRKTMPAALEPRRPF